MRRRNTMGAIFIDALHGTVRKTRMRLDRIEGRLGCRMASPIMAAPGLCLYVQAHKGRRKYGFSMRGYPFPLKGNGVLVACGAPREELPGAVAWSVEEVRERVAFFVDEK